MSAGKVSREKSKPDTFLKMVFISYFTKVCKKAAF